MRYQFLAFLMVLSAALSAEVVEYQHGQTIVVPLKVNTATVNHIRMVMFLGAQKLTIKGTWRAEDLDVVQSGNGIRLALRNGAMGDIPVGVIGDNGTYYHVVVKTAPPEAQLDPTVTVIAPSGGVGPSGSPGSGVAADLGDPGQVSGGHWEHETNLVLRLHKHIRGGRPSPSVQGRPLFNVDALRNEKKRIPGERWKENDDWKVYAHYQWDLEGVRAYLIGVTYTGREDEAEFDYLRQQTERSITIWHLKQPGDGTVLNRKYPGIKLQRGREEWFFLYTSATLP